MARVDACQARATSDQRAEQATVNSPDMAGPFLAKNSKGSKRRQDGCRLGQLPFWCKTAGAVQAHYQGPRSLFPL